MRAPVRFGIVGAGCIGQEHIRNLLIAPADVAQLVAVADPNDVMLAEAKKLTRVNCFASVDEMVAKSEMDAVIVAVPNYLHVDLCEKLLKKGKFHILCEKPIATTLEDCERLVRAIEGSDKVFAVGLEYRHIPPMRKLLENLDKIGDPTMVTIREHRFPFLRKIGLWNRDNDKSGGTLVEKGCHFFDFFRLCAKGRKPTTVYARGGQAVNFHNEAPGVLDHAVVIVDFEEPGLEKMLGTLELSMFAEASKNQLEVSAVGAQGKIEAFAPAHGVKHDDKSMPNFRLGLRRSLDWEKATGAPPESHTIGAVNEEHVPIDADLMLAGDHAGATYYELVEFARACQDPHHTSRLASVYDATFSVAVGVAAQLSITQGKVIDVRDLLPPSLYNNLNHLEKKCALTASSSPTISTDDDDGDDTRTDLLVNEEYLN